MPSESSELACSFCGKSQKSVRELIAVPNVYMCDECIVRSSVALRSNHAEHKQVEPDSLAPITKKVNARNDRHCSFCGQNQTTCRILISEGGFIICDGCVERLSRVESDPLHADSRDLTTGVGSCDFCGKPENEAVSLFEGDNAGICSECLAFWQKIIAKKLSANVEEANDSTPDSGAPQRADAREFKPANLDKTAVATDKIAGSKGGFTWPKVLAMVVGATSLCSFIQHVFSIGLKSMFFTYIDYYRRLLHPIISLFLLVMPFRVPERLIDLWILSAILGGVALRTELINPKSFWREGLDLDGPAKYVIRGIVFAGAVLNILLLVPLLVSFGHLFALIPFGKSQKSTYRTSNTYKPTGKLDAKLVALNAKLDSLNAWMRSTKLHQLAEAERPIFLRELLMVVGASAVYFVLNAWF